LLFSYGIYCTLYGCVWIVFWQFFCSHIWPLCLTIFFLWSGNVPSKYYVGCTYAPAVAACFRWYVVFIFEKWKPHRIKKREKKRSNGNFIIDYSNHNYISKKLTKNTVPLLGHNIKSPVDFERNEWLVVGEPRTSNSVFLYIEYLDENRIKLSFLERCQWASVSC
jgi:hypothetical protein